MQFTSLYPPISYFGSVSKTWFIIANGQWHSVERQYSWKELKSMWQKIEYNTNYVSKTKNKQSISTHVVQGSKGNIYEVTNDNEAWTCSCPAFNYGNGSYCKHIKELKIIAN